MLNYVKIQWNIDRDSKKGTLTMPINNELFIFPVHEKENLENYNPFEKYEVLSIPVIFTKGVLKGQKGMLLGELHYLRNEGIYDLDKMEVKLSNDTIVTTSIKNIKQIRNYIKKSYKDTLIFKDFDKAIAMEVTIHIRGKRTTVILNDGTKGTVYCNIKDTYNKKQGIDRAFHKALANKLLKVVNK